MLTLTATKYRTRSITMRLNNLHTRGGFAVHSCIIIVYSRRLESVRVINKKFLTTQSAFTLSTKKNKVPTPNHYNIISNKEFRINE